MELIPLAISISEACKWSGLGRTSIYQAISRGDLRVKKAGRRTLISLDDLRAWFSSLPEAKNSRNAA